MAVSPGKYLKRENFDSEEAYLKQLEFVTRRKKERSKKQSEKMKAKWAQKKKLKAELEKKQEAENKKEFESNLQKVRNRNRAAMGDINNIKREDQEISKQVIITSFEEACDIETACGLAKVTRDQYYAWIKKDKKFNAACIFARESAVRTLVQKCKKESNMAWKLLKNMARGRYTDEPSIAIGGKNIKILFNTPRPNHKLADNDFDETGKKIVASTPSASNSQPESEDVN